MKLKVTSKSKENAEKIKEENRRRGKRSKTKGSNYERDVAKKFQSKYGEELVRTPQSGGFAKKSTKADDFRGDIVLMSEDKELVLHIECKNTQTWSLPKWFAQAESDCPKGKKPVIVFHKHNTSKNYIALSLEDFFDLVDKDKVIREVKKK